jgi:predicted enzyme related to lactoylglutathione lyase
LLGDDMERYVVATTTATGDDHRPKEPGAINGGFYAKNAERPAQYPSVVIAVDDIHDAARKVEQAGGKVLGDPVEIPGIGEHVSFTDTEGNRVAMLQPRSKTTQSPKTEKRL